MLKHFIQAFCLVFFIFAIPQISFIRYYVPTGNISVFGCMMQPILRNAKQVLLTYFSFIAQIFFLEKKAMVLTLVF